ncbi:hypothetical protein DAPPUDRAFT_329599 [Daphnia pulex]|uniref:Uncharacterized protein n=1 Tax=Daphnia pulex TaxID=6669 RepID=E9HH35_DAPPU|nr:hypothetical protein DAPPUDRAFT_329599 [Daphnia pulex]|eukprot:EFX68925.1 hypothetical protein DAPPUDRAFT_329599 [Daphnia pulex]
MQGNSMCTSQQKFYYSGRKLAEAVTGIAFGHRLNQKKTRENDGHHFRHLRVFLSNIIHVNHLVVLVGEAT